MIDNLATGYLPKYLGHPQLDTSALAALIQNRKVLSLNVRQSSQLLPTPVPGTSLLDSSALAVLIQKRKVWSLNDRQSSHGLPTPVPGTPTTRYFSLGSIDPEQKGVEFKC